MSSVSATLEPQVAARGADKRPSLLRLTGVELRKMVDTRAGFWLLASIVALTITVVATIFFVDDADRSLRGFFVDSSQVAQTLLPIVGILLVSSEGPSARR